MDFIKKKNLHASKDHIITNMKWQYIECVKIFANHVSHRGWVLKIYEEHLQLYNKKANNPILKWAKDWVEISPVKLNKFQQAYGKISHWGNMNQTPW